MKFAAILSILGPLNREPAHFFHYDTVIEQNGNLVILNRQQRASHRRDAGC